MPTIFKILPSLFIFSLLISCTAEQTKQLKVKPTALGKAGEIVVIVDSVMWYGAVGEAFQETFGELFLVSPSPEELFDIKAVSPRKLNRYKKEQRNIVMLGELNDKDSPTTQMLKESIGEENQLRSKEEPSFGLLEQKHRWAEGQTIFYLFGYTDDQLIKNIQKSYPTIKAKFTKNDLVPLKGSLYLDGRNGEVIRDIEAAHGVKLSIPSDFYIAKQDGKTTWLRKETRDLSSNIIIHSAPYGKDMAVNKRNIIALRDSLGRQYISTEAPGSYMRTDSLNLPLYFQEAPIKGNYALQARGIWNIKNDFMGGAFISYMVYEPSRNKVIFLDGFVHAPNKGKRNYIHGLDYIFQTLTFL